MRVWTTATIGALALFAATEMTQAASIGGAGSALRTATEGTAAAEKIAYRRCWWRQGVRYCRRYRSTYYPYYGVPSNQPYSSGSSIGIIMGIQ
jgi:hypothetical protein